MPLNPNQFFHGTAAELKVGDIVKPAAAVGQRIYPNLAKWRSEKVWATPSEAGAWNYADTAEHHSGPHANYSGAKGTATRGRVYEVEPIGRAEKRRRLNSLDPPEHTMDSARVVRQIDIPHPHSQQGGGGDNVQGRLPLSESWDNYKGIYPHKNIEENWAWHDRRADQRGEPRSFTTNKPEVVRKDTSIREQGKLL